MTAWNCRIFVLGLLLMQSIVYGQNYDTNPFLNGYANDVNAFITDQQKQNEIDMKSNVFLSHAVSSRAAQFSGPQYLPPVEKQQLICSGQEVCVRKNSCQNGYFTSQDLNRDSRQDCDSATETCCLYKPPVKPSTPCSGSNYACVSPNQCSNGEVNIDGFQKQSSSDKCFAPEVCCRIPPPDSTILQHDGYVLRTPENPLNVPDRPQRPQQPQQPRPQQPRPQQPRPQQPRPQQPRPTPAQPRQPYPQQPQQPQPPQQPQQPYPQQPQQPYPQQPQQPTPQQPRPQTPRPQQPQQPRPQQPQQPRPTPPQPRQPTPQQPRQPTPQQPRPQPPRIPTTNAPEYLPPRRDEPQPQQPRPQQPRPQQPQPPRPQQPQTPRPQQPRPQQPQQPRPQQPRPQQPSYPTPQQPGYPTPQQPSYPTPQQPSYPTPSQPGYPTPPQPSQPSYPTPTQPQRPQQPRPQQPTYPSQPQQPRPQQPRPQQPRPQQPRPQQPPQPPTYLPPREDQPRPTPSRPDRPDRPDRPNRPNIPDRGEGILSEPIPRPQRPIPPITSNDISEPQVPSTCAAALNCTQIEYCTATGDISDTPVSLTPDQELFRVPLTDCYSQEKGFYGKCCRDLGYTDPWPVSQLGQYQGIDFGDDGSYKPEQVRRRRAKISNNNVKRGVSEANTPVVERVSISNVVPNSKCATRNLDATPLGIQPIDAPFSMYPWQAMVLLESTKSLLCGGIIIAPDVVATAAHCVHGRKNFDVLIKGGEWKLGRDEEPLTFQLSRAKLIDIHPEYDSNTLHNDMALIHLDSQLKFDSHIGALCLNDTEPQPTDECHTTGWGKLALKVHLQDAIMHHSPVQYLSRDQCDQADETKICGKPDIDACDLDPGSALACTSGNGQYVLKGIFSSENQCGNSVIFFAKPDLTWIHKSLQNNGKSLI